MDCFPDGPILIFEYTYPVSELFSVRMDLAEWRDISSIR